MLLPSLQNISIKRKILRKIKKILDKMLSVYGRTKVMQIYESFRLLKLNKEIGNNTFIDKSVHITGWSAISIGSNTAISEYTWINVNNRTPNHKHIIIGDNCYIGRRNFFSSGWQIDIGDYVMTGIDCKLMGSDHIFNTPFMPYIATGTTNDKIIKLGINVRLGAGVMVIGNVTIGHGSIIGAGTLVNKDIPPFSIAVGNPCKVIKRFDFNTNHWVSIQDYDENTQNMVSEEEYKAKLRLNHPTIHIPLQAASRQFGDMF